MLGSDGIGSKKSPRVIRGQLLLPTQGATGGILIGGDVALYREGAYILRAPSMVLTTTRYISFRDIDIQISSKDDGYLDFDADGAIRINTTLNLMLNQLRMVNNLELQEITTPTAVANYGNVYTKNDNKLYFQDGAGVEHTVAFV